MAVFQVYRNLLIFHLILVILGLVLGSEVARTADYRLLSTSAVAAGVTYKRYEFLVPKAKVHLLEIKRDAAYQVTVATPHGKMVGLQSVGALAQQAGAVAGINGGFFSLYGGDRQPVGYIFRDGRLIYKSDSSFPSIGFIPGKAPLCGAMHPTVTVEGAGGVTVPVHTVNRRPGREGVALLTAEYGGPLPDGLAILLRRISPSLYQRVDYGMMTTGAKYDAALVLRGTAKIMAQRLAASTQLTVRYSVNPGWQQVTALVSGGPQLVDNGKAGGVGAFQQYRSLEGHNPRTAVGADAAGNVLMCVIEGRFPDSPGVMLAEWAAVLLRLGFYEALGMDGGDSSAMWVKGKYVNRLSGLSERPVNSALVVIPR